MLESRKLIKALKSVASSNRKARPRALPPPARCPPGRVVRLPPSGAAGATWQVYMLFELEPSREITGGAWCGPWGGGGAPAQPRAAAARAARGRDPASLKP